MRGRPHPMADLVNHELSQARSVLADVAQNSDPDLLSACCTVIRLGDPCEASRAEDLKTLIEGERA